MKIIQRPSPNFDAREEKKTSIILLHYTGMKTAEDALARLTDPESKVSAHYTIDEVGSVYQHVEEGNRAWHAGQSNWQGETNINALSIGIEIVNPGHEFGYREFPLVQIEAVQKLCHDIMARHKIEHVLAHSDVAPTRKQDPGELFPWQVLAKVGIGVWPHQRKSPNNFDINQALSDFGYDITNPEKALIAFQRHYVPEAFKSGTQGQVCDLTMARLYALLFNKK